MKPFKQQALQLVTVGKSQVLPTTLIVCLFHLEESQKGMNV